MVDENALKDGWRELLRLHPMPLFVTLQFNDIVDSWEARKRLKDFYAAIDSQLIGKRYKNRPKQRTKFIAVQEFGRKNKGTHFHLMLDPALGKINQFTEIAPKVWREVWKKGTTDVQQIPTEKDFEIVASYVTKEAFKQEVRENIILHLDFL